MGAVKHYLLNVLGHYMFYICCSYLYRVKVYIYSCYSSYKGNVCSIQRYVVCGNNLYTNITTDPVKRYTIDNITVEKLNH